MDSVEAKRKKRREQDADRARVARLISLGVKVVATSLRPNMRQGK